MRKRASLIVEIVKIIINCIIVPLYFIKFFCDEALLRGLMKTGSKLSIGGITIIASLIKLPEKE